MSKAWHNQSATLTAAANRMSPRQMWKLVRGPAGAAWQTAALLGWETTSPWSLTTHTDEEIDLRYQSPRDRQKHRQADRTGGAP